MKAARLALLLVAACAGDDPLSVTQRPIVGGTVVTTGYEGVVMVDLGGATCTGTLIGPHTVLTAAHCVADVDPKTTNVEVGFGNSAASLTRVKVLEARIERRYDPSRFFADTAILRLQTAVTTVPLVPINTQDVAPLLQDGMVVRSVGFGLTAEGATDSGTKRQALMTVRGFTDELITYGDDTANICRGDSGGPQFALTPTGEIQVSISSFSQGRCGNAANSTRVDRVMPFISAFLDAWDGPCRIDGTCVTSCPGHPDPDCDPCGPEGTCAADCPEIDYDCPLGVSDGEKCTTDSQCEHRACFQAPDDPAVKYCAAECDLDGACPLGQQCVAVNGRQRCVFDTPTPRTQSQPCANNDACFSGICERAVCVTPCDPDADTCPDESSCRAATAAPFACFPGGSGGCAVGLGGRAPAGGVLLLLALLGLSARRRSRRPAPPPRR